MLSTVIISAAFTTGDTINRSVTNEVYELLGSVDQMVVSGNADEVDLDDETVSVTRDVSFAESDVAAIVTRLRDNPDVDAIVPMYSDIAVAVNETKQLSSPLFNLSGIDPQARPTSATSRTWMAAPSTCPTSGAMRSLSTRAPPTTLTRRPATRFVS